MRLIESKTTTRTNACDLLGSGLKERVAGSTYQLVLEDLAWLKAARDSERELMETVTQSLSSKTALAESLAE